jgi:hypothetical protein
MEKVQKRRGKGVGEVQEGTERYRKRIGEVQERYKSTVKVHERFSTGKVQEMCRKAIGKVQKGTGKVVEKEQREKHRKRYKNLDRTRVIDTGQGCQGQ